MSDRPSNSSFIIATRNRPKELVVTVRSLVEQTVLPGELCIVDSSEETPARAEIEKLCSKAALPLDYHHPAPKGLTIQRNVGIDRDERRHPCSSSTTTSISPPTATRKS